MNPEYGELIRAARRKAGLSQQTLASSLGMSRCTLSQIESGTITEIGVRKLARLCNRLNLEVTIQPKKRLPTLNESYARNETERRAAFIETDSAIANFMTRK